MKLLRGLARDRVKPSALMRAIEHERERYAYFGIDVGLPHPAEELTGIDALFPLRVAKNGATILSIVSRQAGQYTTPETHLPHLVPPDSPDAAEVLWLAVKQGILPITATEQNREAPLTLTWLEDRFYAFESELATHLVYAVVDSELMIKGLACGPGYGNAERLAVSQPFAIETLPCSGRFVVLEGGDHPLTNDYYSSRPVRYGVKLMTLDNSPVLSIRSPVDGYVRAVIPVESRESSRHYRSLAGRIEIAVRDAVFCVGLLAPQSIRVRAGSRVRCGDLLGESASDPANAQVVHMHASTNGELPLGIPFRLLIEGRMIEPLRSDLVAQEA